MSEFWAGGHGGARGSDCSVPPPRTHYVLLVFLKVPFLLGLVGAVLWLEERQRDPAAQWEEPIYANLSSELLTKDAPV